MRENTMLLDAKNKGTELSRIGAVWSAPSLFTLCEFDS